LCDVRRCLRLVENRCRGVCAQEDITAYGKEHGTEQFKWRACLISCKFVLEKGGLYIPVFDGFLNTRVSKVIQISSLTNEHFPVI